MAIDGRHVVAQGSGPVSAPRDALLRVRIARDGLDALDAKARALDMNRSQAVRAALRAWAPPAVRPHPPAETPYVTATGRIVTDVEAGSAAAAHRHRRTMDPVETRFEAGHRVEVYGCQEPGCNWTSL